MNYKVIDRRTAYRGFFNVDEVRLRFEKFKGGMSGEVRRILMYKNEAVASMLYLTDSEEIVLIRQFRMATAEKHDGWIIECVAGGIEQEEQAEEAIRREILEETGYGIAGMEKISSFYVSPGITNEYIHLYLAYSNETLSRENVYNPDSEEDIELLRIPLRDLPDWLISGRIVDAKTLVGLYELQRRIGS